MTDDSCIFCQNDVMATLSAVAGPDLTKDEILWCAGCGAIKLIQVDAFGDSKEQWRSPAYDVPPRSLKSRYAYFKSPDKANGNNHSAGNHCDHDLQRWEGEGGRPSS